MELLNNLTEWADKFTIWVALITLGFTLRNWFNNRKQQQKISLQFHTTDTQQTHPLHFQIKRAHCTRSEVQGLIGAQYQAGKRYNIPFLATPEFFDRLKAVQEGKNSILIIDIKQQDLPSALQQATDAKPC